MASELPRVPLFPTLQYGLLVQFLYISAQHPLKWKAFPTYTTASLNPTFLIIITMLHFSLIALATIWDTIYLLIYQVSQLHIECKHYRDKYPDSSSRLRAQSKVWHKNTDSEARHQGSNPSTADKSPILPASDLSICKMEKLMAPET